MGCGCRVIAGGFAEAHKKISSVPVDPTTTAYTAGDAIIVSSVQTENDFFFCYNGNADLVELTIFVTNPTATPKKGIEVVFFSQAPSASMAAAINAGVTLGSADIALITNRVQVVTADYVDCWQGSIARKNLSAIVENKVTAAGGNKTALWYAVLATEGQTYTTGGFISITMDFRLN